MNQQDDQIEEIIVAYTKVIRGLLKDIKDLSPKWIKIKKGESPPKMNDYWVCSRKKKEISRFNVTYYCVNNCPDLWSKRFSHYCEIEKPTLPTN